MVKDLKYLDTIDLFCQFSDQLELAVNAPDYSFMQRRMDFMHEEVQELQEGLMLADDVEIVDGAAGVAFIAITQIYHAFRNKGFGHVQSVVKTRSALLEVGKANIRKLPPTKPVEKIKKPEGWQSPNQKIADLINEPWRKTLTNRSRNHV